MKCKNCKWYDDDTNTCKHPACARSYDDVGPEDGCETASEGKALKEVGKNEFC